MKFNEINLSELYNSYSNSNLVIHFFKFNLKFNNLI